MPDTPATLGEDKTVYELDSSEELRDTSLAMVRQSSRNVYLYTRNLDHAIYDTSEFVEAVSEMVRNHRNAHLHVLVRDSDQAVKHGHRLVLLGQRLSSSIQFRVPAEEYKAFNEAFMVVDETGYIRRELSDRYEAEACFHDPLTARNLRDFFREVWERSAADPQLRPVRI